MGLQNWIMYFAGCLATMFFFVMGGVSGKTTVHANGRRMFALLCVISAYLVGLYFLGLRPTNGGSDTPKYVRTFLALKDLGNAHSIGVEYFGDTEYLFWPLQAVFRLFISSGAVWLAWVYTLTFLLAGLAYLRISKETGTPLVLFVMLLFSYEAVYFGNIIRQVMSYPIGILAIYLYRQRAYGWAALALSVAVGLHWSSLVFVLVPAIQMLRITSRGRAIVFFIGCVLISQLILFLMQRLGAVGGLMSISDKAANYSQGVTYFGEVYTTYNFALAVLLAACFVVAIDFFADKPVVTGCFLLFTGMVLLGVRVPILSERFLTNQLFFAPIVVWAFLLKIVPRPEVLRRIILATVFILMGVLVFSQNSTTYTLGLTKYAN